MQNLTQNMRRKRGKRAGVSNNAAQLRDIHSRVRGVAVHSGIKSNFVATVEDNALYFDAAHLTETAATHIVPRQSITRKQLLNVFPQQRETAPVNSLQLDKRYLIAGDLAPFPAVYHYMIRTTDNRVVWRSDRNLLNRIPSDEIGTFKREGSISVGLNTRRNMTIEPELSLKDSDKIIGPAIEDEPAF